MAWPVSPFAPRLSAVPADWTMAIRYKAQDFKAPKSTTVDASGNVWVANSGNNTLTKLTQQGVATTLSGNGLNAPSAVAIDAGGNAWVANKGGTALTAFTSNGGAVSGSPFAGGAALNQSSAVAVDGAGNIWVGGRDGVTEFNSNGSALQSKATPNVTAIAINPK